MGWKTESNYFNEHKAFSIELRSEADLILAFQAGAGSGTSRRTSSRFGFRTAGFYQGIYPGHGWFWFLLSGSYQLSCT